MIGLGERAERRAFVGRGPSAAVVAVVLAVFALSGLGAGVLTRSALGAFASSTADRNDPADGDGHHRALALAKPHGDEYAVLRRWPLRHRRGGLAEPRRRWFAIHRARDGDE